MSINVSNLIRRMQRAKQESEEQQREQEAGQAQVTNQPPKIIVQQDGETEQVEPQRQDIGQEEPEQEGKDEQEIEQTAGMDEDHIGLEPEVTSQYYWEQKDSREGEKEPENVDIKYPLMPKDPGENETVYAWAHITYDPDREEVIYRLNEPDLSEKMENDLDKVEDRLKETIDIDFGEMKEDEARDFLEDKIRSMLDTREFRLSEREKDVIQYYAYRNFVGLGKIEPLMNDKYVEDISCDGTGVPVYVYHRNPDVGSVKTDVVFDDEDELDAFVRKLAQRCGRSISMAEPLVDGSLPDGSRVQATLGTDIARRGSNFTIRRFTEDPLTPIDIMNFGTVSAEMLAYLWLAIENGKSMLISGPTAAGKTSLLNALSLFIPPELKIVSIEDTPELRLPHPNWVPEVARTGFGFGETQAGEVTLDDLLKESLRQRPDYIIVGEVRGEEAYILFQQIATGHPGMSTIHASSMEKVMDRLTTRPINLPPSLIENLDVIVFIKRVRRRGKYVRRVDAIYELEGYDKENDEPIVNKLFEWDAAPDEFHAVSGSSVLADISEERGVSTPMLQTEMQRRQKIISWMDQQDITHYEQVGQVAANYYRDPERFMERIEAEV